MSDELTYEDVLAWARSERHHRIGDAIEALIRERDEADRKASIAMKAVKVWQGEAQQNFHLGREAGIREAAAKAYPMPHYVNTLEPDELGRLKPGSPYDRGRYDAANDILVLLDKPASDGLITMKHKDIRS